MCVCVCVYRDSLNCVDSLESVIKPSLTRYI